MKTRSRVPLIAAGIASLVVLAFVLLSLSQAEPRYGGKTVTEWAKQLAKESNVESPKAGEAQAAIRAIGTNGIPFLNDLIRTRDSKVKRKLRGIVPGSWHQALRLNDQARERRRIGAFGLSILDTNAASAVPELVKIGKNHPDDDGRFNAVFALSMLGTTSRPAAPFVIQCLTNPVAMVRCEAVFALTQIGLEPEVCLPVLTNHLIFLVGAGATYELQSVIHAFRTVGTNAEAAVPFLVPLLRHKTPEVRVDVTNALSVIQPKGDWRSRQ